MTGTVGPLRAEQILATAAARGDETLQFVGQTFAFFLGQGLGPDRFGVGGVRATEEGE